MAGRDTSHTAWLSRGFEWLADYVAANQAATHFDVLIIGSGYGGAIAAKTFAGRTKAADAGTVPIKVAVLERGKEYLPGAFPTGLRELPRHIRRGSNKEGLFDIRVSPEVNTVLANGLGGGSLINAGVMEQPSDSVFTQGWPAAFNLPLALQQSFANARKLLGSRDKYGIANTILKHPDGAPKKYLSLQAIAPTGKFRPAEITVAMSNETSSGNVQLKQCVRCGDCATGCNFGAKNSLDVSLLASAHTAGAEIYSGATVLRIERDVLNEAWLVHCVHTNAKLRARDARVFLVRATRVVLAAGALGSTEILLRSKAAGLAASNRLGERCSTNGDMLIVDYDTNADVHTVANESTKPSGRNIGPTITGIIDLRTEATPLVIEEMSVPAGLRLAFTEIFATINTLHSLQDEDDTHHSDEFPADDIYAVSDQHIERSALYAVMGDDGAAGTVELYNDDEPLTDDDDGVARIRWVEDTTATPPKKGLPDIALFDKQVDKLVALTGNASTKGRVLPNPVWKLLPKDLEWLLDNKRGPLTTVHPLGGCAMADSAAHGVVDDRGRVFDTPVGPGGVHPGLVVLDGSIIPTALGTNPALTIAAVALRASELLATEWGYQAPPASTAPPPPAPERPPFRDTDEAFVPRATQVEVIERLVGPVEFRDEAGTKATRIVELTLRFAPKDVLDLARAPQGTHLPVLQVATDLNGVASRIRIYNEADWKALELKWKPDRYFERELESKALFAAPLAGSVRVFERQKSKPFFRRFRASWAYLFNRGLRDWSASEEEGDDGGPKLFDRIAAGWALASRAGEIRALKYDLTVGTPEYADTQFEGLRTPHKIEGHKRFTYERKANPWRQLMEVTLDKFPGKTQNNPVLKLDVRHLVRISVPLFRVAQQQDGVTALADLASFVGYFLRLLLGIHIWSFRAPDPQVPGKVVDRLPSLTLPGLPTAQRFNVPLPLQKPAGGGADFAGRVILTHYTSPAPDPAKLPLVMLHGYSASGTTFAHRAVVEHGSIPGSFASYFCKKGWDVWIADLRTSSGQELSAEQHWSFEQIGRVDVPAAINEVLTRTPSATQVDVIAHCMGTVVFSMAVLDPDAPAPGLGAKIRRAAFTQVGPLVVFSPANIFRAYVLRYFLDWLPEHYSFNPPEPTSLADDLFDRLLATLPYPEEEFEIENPKSPSARTPWTRVRHRMDALYGRDFNLVHMEQGVLDNIDDHFGPLSLRTVAQTLHFVRHSLITNYEGHNDFVSRALLQARWPFPTFSVHGAANGLSHVSTVDRMQSIFADAARPYEQPRIIEDAGHQDALVGTNRAHTLPAIEQFLTKVIPPVNALASEALVAYAPWMGPVITIEPRPMFVPKRALVVRVGSAPTHRAAQGVALLRISLDGDRIVRPDDPSLAWDDAYVLPHLAFLYSSELTLNRWDAFDAPEPNLMPGHGPDGTPIGDGLLVLILYAESAELAPPAPEFPMQKYLMSIAPGKLGEFGALTPMPPEMAPVGGGHTPGTPLQPPGLDPTALVTPLAAPPHPVLYSTFEEAVKAVVKVLRAQPDARLRDAAHFKRDGRVVQVTLADDGELALVGNIMTTTSATTIGPATAGQAAAVTAALVEQDSDVLDGVIPWDLPQNPPATPQNSGTRFALLSCQYPAGFLDAPPAYASYRRLLSRLTAATAATAAAAPPRFVVLTGDQVYVDPTAGLYDPEAQDDRYHRPYEVWLRRREVRGALRRVPSFMLLDDHEIDDNWEPLPPAPPQVGDNADKRAHGVRSYRKYQRGQHEVSLDPTSFGFAFDGFPFFMLDTRSERALRQTGSLGTATLFSAATLTALGDWLDAATATAPKFIVTPSMLLPRHRRAVQHAPVGKSLESSNLSAFHSDGWDGYPDTLRMVLGVIAAKPHHHVVFLSGDEHRSCIAEIELRHKGGPSITRTLSIHTSAGYAPFPFANSLAEDFMTDETIEFVHGGTTYECVVKASALPARDGATLLHPSKPAGVWQLECECSDGSVRILPL